MHSTLVQDIAILLLAAGIAGVICKRIGLSVIVGYLVAGIVIGPNTPIKMITDEARIEDLAHVGLVFVMFAIGLHLSLTKLAKMGASTIMATVLGAMFMFMFTLLMGGIMGWDYKQSLFVAGMLMVSSSAVIAKIMEEMHLTHNKTAQMALAITIVEDIVAVVMITILATVGSGAVATGDASSVAAAVDAGGAIAAVEGAVEAVEASAKGLGDIFAQISSYVILIMGLCLLLVPKLLRRLDASGDPELRTIVIAGVLLILAFCAEKAGFSIALGAFLFGAIVAELPQKELIEKSFDSVRALFSSIFFVSIGMMAKPADLLDNWVLVVVLVCFAMFIRPIACGFALMLVGVPPHEARRGGMLLTPLGEFTFIIAQAAIAAAIFEDYFYPVAIALSVFTVLLTPILNRFAEPIINFMEKIEPKWMMRAMLAYHDWLRQVKSRPPSRTVWKFIRPRLVQIVVEMLLVTGILVFSNLILKAIEKQVLPTETSPGAGIPWLTAGMLELIFWSVIGIAVLIPLVAIWRNVAATSLMLAESLETKFLPRTLLDHGFKAASAVMLGFWVYSILPIDLTTFTLWGRLAILVAVVVVIALFSRRLIYWHSAWRVSIREVLANSSSPAEEREEARANLDRGLESWDIHLHECVVPDNAAYSGQTLHDLAIPTRFGSSIVEIERNGHSILTPGPDMRLYPGDKVLLLGKAAEIAQARAFLESKDAIRPSGEIFSRAVLETCVVERSPHAGKSFAELGIARNTGVRVVGIQRGEQRIINPTGREVLLDGDGLLLVGTIEQTRWFTRWLSGAEKVRA